MRAQGRTWTGRTCRTLVLTGWYASEFFQQMGEGVDKWRQSYPMAFRNELQPMVIAILTIMKREGISRSMKAC